MDWCGAYTADRAAALAGVPKSTIHYWAREQILVPSVSPEKIKLWSYPDLLGLRFIYWLRQEKRASEGWTIPRTSMPVVRRVLSRLRDLDLNLFEDDRPNVYVSRRGEVYLWSSRDSNPENLESQFAAKELMDLVAPFCSMEGMRGPDLVRPSRFVRIVPKKLSGAPHIVATRVETLSLHTLERRGFSPAKIARLYPHIEPAAIDDALGVERALAGNLRAAA
jgi:uncharacterized protein (DUF433 family)